MVTYKGLREKVQNLEKVGGCVKVDRSPLINECYPGQFNISFTEEPWIQEYGRYIDFDQDYIFSTIQSCIRWGDIFDEKAKTSKLTGEESWKYLGVFEMADLIGMVSLSRRTDAEELQRKQTRVLIELFTSLGIRKEQIHPSYQAGGEVSTASNGRFNFKFYVPEDTLSRDIFLESGIPEKNLVRGKGRNTFLANKLEIEAPKGRGSVRIATPWGYRNEIDVNIGTRENPKYVDVATLQRFAWNPIYDADWNVVGLRDTNDEVSIGAVGLERLCMVANGLSRVQDVDYIKPVYDALPEVGKRVLVGESLRALHRIYADIKKYGIILKSRRKSSRSRRIRDIAINILDSGLNSGEIRKLLQINAENQPWHPELVEGIDYTLSEIQEYSQRRRF